MSLPNAKSYTEHGFYNFEVRSLAHMVYDYENLYERNNQRTRGLILCCTACGRALLTHFRAQYTIFYLAGRKPFKVNVLKTIPAAGKHNVSRAKVRWFLHN